MAFVLGERQNRQEPNRAFGRGLFNADQGEVQKKAKRQRDYQRQLQQQVQQAKKRKEAEKEKIRKEDQKWQREVDAIVKAEKEKNKKSNNEGKDAPAAYQPKALEQSNSYHYNKNAKKHSLPYLPLDFNKHIDDEDERPLKTENHHPYQPLEEQFPQGYLEERMNKYKDELDAKVQEMFGHIRSTKDALKTEDQLQKIRRRMRKNKQYSQDASIYDYEQEQITKYFSVPKKNNYESKVKNLDHQGYSKYQRKNNSKPRSPIDQPFDQANDYPKIQYQERDKGSRWGERRGKDNYLSNRQALDYQIESIMGRIDNLLNH